MNSRKLRDEAAGLALEKIRSDKHRVHEDLEPLFDVMEERLFDDDFNVNALWRESGVSKEASSWFSGALQVTPGAYLARRRTEVAAVLLAGTRLKVGKIAELVGYRAPTTFSKAFQRCYETSPRQYRRGSKSTALHSPARTADASRPGHAAGRGSGAEPGRERTDPNSRARELAESASHAAIFYHEEGERLLRCGDVDPAYEVLHLARKCYSIAGELPPALARRQAKIRVSVETDDLLLSAFCARCRPWLEGAEGQILFRFLRVTDQLILRTLSFFEVCCDGCYRLVWRAISRARHGQINDAFKAWWLTERVDPRDRHALASHGRIIAIQTAIEAGEILDPLERRGLCELAVADACTLDQPFLEAQTRLWLGDALGAMGWLVEARKELEWAARVGRSIEPLMALRSRIEGRIEVEAQHDAAALDAFKNAARLYQSQDPHLGGLSLLEAAEVHFQRADYASAIDTFRHAATFLDPRREPPAALAVPVRVAVATALAGRLTEAEKALVECDFDRSVHVGAAGSEASVRGGLELLRGHFRESLADFSRARPCFEQSCRPLDKALAELYSVEALIRLGDGGGAVEAALAAVRSFHAADCSRDTFQAARQLRCLLEAEEVDAEAVATAVRDLARRHGGWLPYLVATRGASTDSP